MQQELIEMLEEIIQYVEVCNAHDQGIVDKAGALVEKAKNSAKEPAVPFPGNVELAAFLRKLEHRIMLTRDDKILLAHAADTVEAAPSQETAVPEQAATRSQLTIGRDAIEYEKGQSHKAGYKQGYQQGRADAAKAAPSQEPVTLTELLRHGFAVLMAKAYSEEWFDDLGSIDGLYEFLVAEGERIPDDKTIGGTIEAIIAALREKEGK